MVETTPAGPTPPLIDALVATIGDRAAVTAGARELAGWFVLDAIGVAIAGTVLEAESLDTLTAAFHELFPGEGCTLVGRQPGTSALAAAAINAAAIRLLEYDDSYLCGIDAHFNASLVPMSFALCEELGRSGTDMLEAIVRGYEVAARLGHAAGPAHATRWDSTGTLGAVGCAAAASWLYGLDDRETAAALALAADRAAGGRPALRSGSLAGPMHASFAALDGIVAARLARSGLRGPDDPFGGPQGFIAVYGDAALEAGASDEFERLRIEDNATRFYPAMHGLHAAIACAREIAQARPNLRPADIGAVIVHQPASRADEGANETPATLAAARMSLPYVVAVTLIEGDCSLAQFRDELLHDEDVRELMKRVKILPSKELEERHGTHIASTVAVRVRGGTTAHATKAGAPGTREAPATIAMRREKFRALATMRMGDAAAAELEAQVMALRDGAPVEALGHVLRAAFRPG